MPMRTDLFDFELPPDRIALRPASPRDAARLLVVRPGAAPESEDRSVRDLAELLRPGDQLVVNDTKVIAAQLHGRRIGRGPEAGIEATLIKRLDGARWQALVRPARKLARRRRRALRRRGQRVLSRGARRHRRRKGRGRRNHVRLRLSRAGPRRRDRGAGRGAAAALYRRAPPDRRAGPRRLPDDVRPRGGRGRRADRRPALHAGPPREARRAGSRRCTRSPCMSAPARFSP